MRGTMSLRKKIAILTMASMTVWGVTALLPFNQGRIVGNVGYAAEITPEKQVSMDYKTSGGTTAQTTGDLYYAFIDSTNSWWGHAGQIFVTDSGSIGTATAPLALYGQVLGGQYNTASGNYSVVLGGSGNTASGVYSVVTGGANNIASGRNSIVVSGSTNTASGENASIMGGNTNTASGTNSTIIGGSNNKNGAANGIIIGGNQHELTSGTDTVFVGGTVNKSSGNANQSVLIGGTKNTVGGRQAGIFGGTYNMTAGTLTSVYGGASNTVSGTGTAILGGWSNAASGLYSVLVGGEKGAAQGQYSVALGGASTADTAKDAVAIGIGASANVEKGVAIGAGAVATEAGTISVGHNKGDKYYQTSYTVNGGGTVKEQTYSSNLYNRLVNVGYGKDGHDAATMDQLTKVSAGDRISVASETDQTTGAATYKISVNNDGAVASGDANLVAGGTVYSEVRPSSDGTYVKTASTTGDNLLALDGQVKSNADNISTNTSNIASNATDIRNLKDLSNITADGQTVIKNLAKDAVKVVAGTNTTVTEGTDGDAKTYAVNVADADIKKAVQQDLDGKANVDASNVTDENVGKWQSKLGNGALASGNTGLVTGGTVYAYETPTKLAGQTEFKYVQTDYTTGQNLAALDKGVSDNATDITNLSEKVANIKVGKTQLADGTNTTVTSETDTTTDTTTWKVNVSKDAIKDAVKEDLSGKANVDASNLTDENVTRWQSKLGNGTIASSNIGLVTGGTVYSEVRPSSDGTYVKTASTTGDNLLALDGQVKSNADNISTNTSNIASNATDIRNLKDLSNITADGQTVIKKAAVGAITVKAGDRVEVQMEKATDGSSVTYTVSAKNDGKVAKDDANLVSGDTVYNAIEDAKNAIDTDMDTKVSNKADIDASNVGKNLKGDDGSTAASDDAIQQNLNAWGSAVGTGTIDKNNGQLVTGGTVYTEVRPKEDGTYVKMASTTGDNLLALDKQVGTNTKNITDLTNLTNITDAGKTVIKNLAKGTIDMENGSYTTVSSREVDGVKTFKVDVASDGKVEEGNSGLVTGDTVYDALNKASQDTNKNLDKKANIDASNIGSNLKNADGTAASEEDQKKNAESWGKAIGTGKVKESDNRLVTGDTVAKAIKDETRVSEDGTYVKKDATAGENLKNLDDQVKKNTDNITSIKNITDNLDNNYAKTDLSNVTDEGKTTIKNLAQDAVKVVNGKNTTVTTKTETNGNISYAVNVDDSAIKDVMKEDMDKKADRDAGNLTDSDVTSWQKKLGTGESQSGDHRLISGDTLYNALKEVDGNTLMKTDGVTINIDQTGTAKAIDVRGKDGVTRTITGIATDPSDPTSAANVDYVDHRVESLNSRMTHDVSRAGAGAAALAALHPLEWDPDSKFEFALGYGHYKAANAAALGLFYRPNEDVMYNLGGTLGNGDAMMSGGVTFRFGTKGRKPKASPLAMQQTIMDQNAKIEHQDEMLKIQANKIDSLEKELLDLKRLITQK
ncbi:YadA-like family protein [Acidaminococcus intestini]|uniref:YadA-like family protein n=1 Tax=Acidaminococcus intestini TaxID=187327 RepID=UPI003079C200